MSAILFMTGTTRGDALGCIVRGISSSFARFGFETIEVNFNDPDVLKKLDVTLREKDILFAFTIAGIGRDISINDAAGNPRNLWDLLEIPFISAHGDSPAYFFDRHINENTNFASVYAFREHYELRKRLTNQTGTFGISSPFVFDGVSKDAIDFSKKETGKLVFLKNSNDTQKLIHLWKNKCRPSIVRMLVELANVLENNLSSGEEPDIDELVTGYFKIKSIDVDSLLNLRLFFIAQLDDYLRRLKCNLIADVLKDFPVEIHGDNWDHLDLAHSKCTLVKACDYQTSSDIIANSLGIIDMSPNTNHGFHDRPVRSYGRHTLCLSNEQECLTQTFGEDNGMTFRFDRDSIAARISEVLAHPKDYVAIGIEAARIFNEKFPAEVTVRSFTEMADAMRLASVKKNPAMQDFFVWPPTLA